jgi:hypothetical protein
MKLLLRYLSIARAFAREGNLNRGSIRFVTTFSNDIRSPIREYHTETLTLAWFMRVYRVLRQFSRLRQFPLRGKLSLLG